MIRYKAIIIGGGPAGLSAALAAGQEGAPILIIEREARLGGILKQCIHDGFGVIRFGEKLSGPEYSERFIDEVLKYPNIEIKRLHFVTSIEKKQDIFYIKTTSTEGIVTYAGESLIFANGCRERTARQVSIHGTRPAGVMTAGVAQNYVNLMGVLPTKKCVILGSGDIGLIMARRLTLEGAEVLGVYEAKSTPSGLTRNISQCLNDFNIPLHLSKTVTRVFGQNRLEAVEVMSVDEKMTPIDGTAERISCDALVISVGLIPENELAEGLQIEMDSITKGPRVDQNMMTSMEGVYSVGNALHVHDLVDYVSECAEIAGRHALTERRERRLVPVEREGMLYLVPQRVDGNALEKATFYFRSDRDYSKGTLRVYLNGEEIYKKNFVGLKPPEMERVEVTFPPVPTGAEIRFVLEGKHD